jgi:hypothetical protein
MIKLENAGNNLDIECVALSNDGLLTEPIRNIFQIYEFDLVLVRLKTELVYEFEVPLSEWLRELVSVAKSGSFGVFERKLTFSGYDFSVNIDADSVSLNVRDLTDYNKIMKIPISRSQLPHVINLMREFLIKAYERYGGDRNHLEDLPSYILE